MSQLLQSVIAHSTVPTSPANTAYASVNGAVVTYPSGNVLVDRNGATVSINRYADALLDTPPVPGQLYRFEVDVVAISHGWSVGIGDTGTTPALTTVGVQTVYATAATANPYAFIGARGNTNATVEIASINISAGIAVDGTSAPIDFAWGLPLAGAGRDVLSGGALAIDTVGAIDHYHQGLPFTAQSRVAASVGEAVVRHGNGAAPFDANDRLAFADGTADEYLASVGFSNDAIATDLRRLNSVQFNGVDQYGTMLPWVPTTALSEYAVDFTVDTAATGVPQRVLSGPTSAGTHALTISTSGVVLAEYRALVGGGYERVSLGRIADAARHLVEVMYYSDRFEASIDGGVPVVNNIAPEPPSMSVLAARATPVQYFGGRIHSVILTDSADPTNSRNYPINESGGGGGGIIHNSIDTQPLDTDITLINSPIWV